MLNHLPDIDIHNSFLNLFGIPLFCILVNSGVLYIEAPFPYIRKYPSQVFIFSSSCKFSSERNKLIRGRFSIWEAPWFVTGYLTLRKPLKLNLSSIISEKKHFLTNIYTYKYLICNEVLANIALLEIFLNKTSLLRIFVKINCDLLLGLVVVSMMP